MRRRSRYAAVWNVAGGASSKAVAEPSLQHLCDLGPERRQATLADRSRSASQFDAARAIRDATGSSQGVGRLAYIAKLGNFSVGGAGIRRLSLKYDGEIGHVLTNA